MSAYEVRLSGCDDTTRFVMDLTEADAALLQRVAALSRETSTYGCEPTMTVTVAATQDEEVPF